ncbi:MAG: zinc-ribbon domain-containing protein [Calditrichaeota bacterium]|nr:zinc-ribbon domain-containing protein [Calditrichota bacterium]
MECRSCGHENQEDTKFCTQCGAELEKDTRESKYCPRCGMKNTTAARFCSDCGQSLSQNQAASSRAPKQRPPQKRRNKAKNAKEHKTSSSAVTIVFVAIIAIVSIIVVKKYTSNHEPQRISPVQTTSLNPLADAQVLSVTSKFRCSCGTCGGTPLDECSCPTAENEKKYIARILAGGMNVDAVIARVDSVYGWIKPEFKPTVSEDS